MTTHGLSHPNQARVTTDPVGPNLPAGSLIVAIAADSCANAKIQCSDLHISHHKRVAGDKNLPEDEVRSPERVRARVLMC